MRSPGGELPHSYPFRFVDVVTRVRTPDSWEGDVRVLVTANGRAAMGEEWGSPLLLAEAIAQSALLLEGASAEEGRRGFLAGLDGFEATRAPRAGETLEVTVRLAARFGGVVRFDGEVSAGGDRIARGAILVRQGGGAPG